MQRYWAEEKLAREARCNPKTIDNREQGSCSQFASPSGKIRLRQFVPGACVAYTLEIPTVGRFPPPPPVPNHPPVENAQRSLTVGKRYILPDGEKVRQLRLARAWRQEDLARKTGCSKRTIENLESGKRVECRTLDEVAQALEVPSGELLPGAQTE